MIDTIPANWQDIVNIVCNRSNALVIAVFTDVGSLIYKNRGFNRIFTMLDHINAPTLIFINPAFNEIVQFVSRDTKLFKGQITLGDRKQVHIPLQGEIHRRDNEICIIGEYNIEELERASNNISSLNQKVNKLNRDLMKKQCELTHALSELSDKTALLQESNIELEQFAHIAAHDLKSPLSNIHGFTSLLQSKGFSNPEKSFVYIEHILTSAERMRTLIDDLLQHSRLDMQEIEKEPVDLNTIMKKVSEELQIEIEKNNAKLLYNALPSIHGNQTLLLQLFLNLCSNAIKYKKPNQSPVIKIDAENKPDHIEITVADNGMGIEKQYYETIFTIFERINATPDIDGTGIGLATCKKIVQKHNGTISVTSEVGKGSVFSIQFHL